MHLNSKSQSGHTELTQIAIVDRRQFSRECMKLVLMPKVFWHTTTYSDVNDALHHRPDVIVMYIKLKEQQELRRILTTVRENSLSRFILFVDEPPQAFGARAREVIQSGVRGMFSTMDSGASMLAAAVDFVLSGGTFLPISLTFDKRPHATESKDLTGRQAQIFERLKEGKTNKSIADELGMSESTIKVHVRNIMRKFGAKNRTEAVFRESDAGK